MKYILVSNKGRQTTATFETLDRAKNGKKIMEIATSKEYHIMPFVGKPRKLNDNNKVSS